MSDQDNSKTYVRETRTTESSGSGMALIIGGLVVAVGFILWLIFGGSGPVVATDPVSDTTNVTIDPAPDAAADPVVPVEPAPADDAAEPAAPAEPTAPPANP